MVKLDIGVMSPLWWSHRKNAWRTVLRKTYIIRPIFITILVVFVYSCSKFIRLRGLNRDISLHSNSHARNVEEVYATLVCPPTPNPASKNRTDYYFEAARILVYRLLHKPSTKDLHGRGLIVLATEAVLPEQIRQLRLDGAIVHTVSAIRPPKGISVSSIRRWKDQYTKLILWNMTKYSKILYIDTDILPIRPLSTVFNTPLSIDKEGHPYLYAATYDSSRARSFGKFTRRVPVLGPNDTHAGNTPHAGLFLIHPSHRQAEYVQSIYDNPPKGLDFRTFMEQSMLKYAYRETGDYPWTRLPQIYNTQWPRLEDMAASYALHHKFWKDKSYAAWNVKRFWYIAWGEMQGWSDERRRNMESGQ